MAAAGLVWKAKELLSKDKKTEAFSLMSQPSIVSWHDMPIAQE